MNNCWVSVEVAYPPTRTPVLVADDKGYIAVAEVYCYLEEDQTYHTIWSTYDIVDTYSIKWWMTIPEVPDADTQ